MFTQQSGRGRGPAVGRPGISAVERHTVPVNVGGFSLVEVVVALTILTVGVLALGASTAHAMARIQDSELRAERLFVARQATELLRGTEWASLESVCSRGLPAFGSGEYSARCAVSRPAGTLKWVVIETTGPGFVSGTPVPSLMETTSIGIARPVAP